MSNGNPKQVLQRGEALIKQHRYAEGIKCLEAVLDPTNLDGTELIALAGVYAAAGNLRRATIELQQAYDKQGTKDRQFSVFNDLLRLYSLQGREDICRKLIRELLPLKSGQGRRQIMFFTLPKSAGSSLCASVATALNVNKCASGCDIAEMAHYSAGWLHPELMRRLSHYRIIHQTHALPVSRNLTLLRHAEHKFVVNIRDPRDAVLSYFHMGNEFRFHRARFVSANPGYNELDQIEQFRFVVDAYFELFVNWIIGWLRIAAANPDRVLVTTFEQIAGAGETLVGEVTQFLTSERRNVDQIAKVHFRQGAPRTDDLLLTPTLRRSLFERIPSKLSEAYGWRP